MMTGPYTRFLLSALAKRQTAVSHSTTEAEMIAGAVFLLRLTRRAFRALRQHWLASRRQARLTAAYDSRRSHNSQWLRNANSLALQFWSSRLKRKCFALWQARWAAWELRWLGKTKAVRRELLERAQGGGHCHSSVSRKELTGTWCNLCQAFHTAAKSTEYHIT